MTMEYMKDFKPSSLFLNGLYPLPKIEIFICALFISFMIECLSLCPSKRLLDEAIIDAN